MQQYQGHFIWRQEAPIITTSSYFIITSPTMSVSHFTPTVLSQVSLWHYRWMFQGLGESVQAVSDF